MKFWRALAVAVAALACIPAAAQQVTLTPSSGAFQPLTLSAALTTTGTGSQTLAFPSSSFTYTFPSASDTVVVLGQGQTFTGANTFSNTTTIGGNVTAAFGTVGTGIIGGTYTQTDNTTGVGTVATAYAHKINPVTFATATNAVTITNAYGLDVEPPVQGANTTITTAFAALLNGRVSINGTLAMNSNGISNTNGVSVTNANGPNMVNSAASSTVPTFLPNRSSATGGVGADAAGDVSLIGGSTEVDRITSGGHFFKTITTGTNADVLCMAAGGLAQIQAAASCTISSLRFKELVKDYRSSVLSTINSLRVITFRFKDWKKNKDPNAQTVQIGLVAEDIAKKMPLCAMYENDMKTPKTYRLECVTAALVKGMQEQQAEITYLKSERLAGLLGLIGLFGLWGMKRRAA